MYRVYQVQNGDTIESIAKKVDMSVKELTDLNGLTNTVTVGQLLVIPNKDTVFDVYKVVVGDNLYEIAKKFNVSLVDLVKLNGLNKDDYIYAGQEILVPRKGVFIYITNNEETLKSVALKLGVNETDLIAQNQTLYLLPDQLIIHR
ncbi:MAG: LysM peptidoglycan-binding domain-containing protein [Bacilli bacterium]